MDCKKADRVLHLPAYAARATQSTCLRPLRTVALNPLLSAENSARCWRACPTIIFPSARVIMARSGVCIVQSPCKMLPIRSVAIPHSRTPPSPCHTQSCPLSPCVRRFIQLVAEVVTPRCCASTNIALQLLNASSPHLIETSLRFKPELFRSLPRAARVTSSCRGKSLPPPPRPVLFRLLFCQRRLCTP